MARKQPKKMLPLKKLWQNNLLVGFVAGILAGLLMAIIIAMIVSSSPMSFNSKNSRHQGEQESAKTIFSDPNQPMYGNKDAPKEAYQNGQNADDSAPDIVNASEHASYLQAGAYRERHDAENMRARLALLGLEAHVSEVDSQNGTLFRVRLGPYPQSQVIGMQEKLSENDIEYTTIRVTN